MTKKKYPYQNLSLKDMNGELWEDIPGLDGYFVISNYGRVKRMEYEMTYRNGAIYIKPEKIIKPTIVKAPNKYIGDHIFFLTNRVILSGKRYSFTIGRLVYYCFVQPFDFDDKQILILTKDCNNLNIRPSNLFAATRNEKQKRIFERKRARNILLDFSEEFRQEIRKKIIKNKSKQVTQYTKTGNKIKTFSSMAAAQRVTGVHGVSIAKNAMGKVITAGGFIWRWENKKKINVNAKEIKAARRKDHRKNYKIVSVTQYDMEGNRIAYYPSLTDAEEATGILGSQIGLAARGVYKSAKGYFWTKGNGKEKIDLSAYKWGIGSKNAARSKKIKQFTTEGKYVQTFQSVLDAARYMNVNSGTMSGACRGYQKTCGGYKWKFA